MTPLLYDPWREPLRPRSRAELIREEQAFYEDHANAEPWRTALTRLVPIPLGIALYALLLGLVPAVH